MNLNVISEQVDKFAGLMQHLNREQAMYVVEKSGVLPTMFKELKALLHENHELIKKYRKDVEEDVNRRRKNLADEQYMMENRLFNDRYQTLLVLAERYEIMKENLHKERQDFQHGINLINRQLGEFTHIWGSFAEKCAIDAAQNFLLNEYNCLTFLSKVKKTIKSDVKPKTQNIEIDFLAENADTVFLLEIKSTLRQETMRQIINNMIKIDTFFPHYQGLKKQPIVAYLSEEEGVADMMYQSGIWLMRPTEVQDDAAVVTFELLKN